MWPTSVAASPSLLSGATPAPRPTRPEAPPREVPTNRHDPRRGRQPSPLRSCAHGSACRDRSRPRGRGFVPRRPGRAHRGFWIALAGGSRSRGSQSASAPGSASAPARRRCSRRWPSSARRASASRSPRRSARPFSAASTPAGGRLAPAARVRHGSPAPQRRHHGLLHLGDHGRARRLRRHLRRDRPPGGHRGGHRGRAGAHARGPARVGGIREHGAGAGVPARAVGVGGVRTTAPRGCPPGRAARPRRARRPVRPQGVATAALIAFVLLLSSTGGRCLPPLPAGSRWPGCSPARSASPCPPAWSSPACWPARRSCSRWAAGSGSRSRCAGPSGPAARARGHLAAGGGARGRATRGLAPRARPAGPRPVGARGLRGARRDCLRGPAGGCRPLPCGSALAGADAAGRLLDAVLAWVVREASAYTPPPPAAPLRLRARPLDWALLASPRRLVLALEPFRAIVGG